jgi:hypothetical protein
MMLGHYKWFSTRTTPSWPSPTIPITFGMLPSPIKNSSADDQYMGLESSSQVEQVFKPERHRKQYIQCPFHQRNGIKSNAYCFQYVPVPFEQDWANHLAEGCIRIWRNYEEQDKAELASTFRAVSDLLPVGHSSGVLTAWEQQKGHLLVGGDMRVVRLWDATVERHLRVSLALADLWS